MSRLVAWGTVGSLCCLVLVACAPSHVTPCGSSVELRPEWEADVDTVEQMTLLAFAAHVTDPRLSTIGRACRALDGVRVVESAIPDRPLSDGGTTRIAGLAQCWTAPRRIELQSERAEDVPLHHTAYAHEAAHILQGCSPVGERYCWQTEDGGIGGCEDDSHRGWYLGGIQTAIDAVYNSEE